MYLNVFVQIKKNRKLLHFSWLCVFDGMSLTCQTESDIIKKIVSTIFFLFNAFKVLKMPCISVKSCSTNKALYKAEKEYKELNTTMLREATRSLVLFLMMIWPELWVPKLSLNAFMYCCFWKKKRIKSMDFKPFAIRIHIIHEKCKKKKNYGLWTPLCL